MSLNIPKAFKDATPILLSSDSVGDNVDELELCLIAREVSALEAVK